ncbi:Tim44 domain-containing protein [Lichenicola sp.]|uniref:Tim44 domain-containing protein n=1 Tax=Lichenicola sp. TaxID=2804529 RepID=UPI003B002048
MTTTRVVSGSARPDASRNRPRRRSAAALAVLLAAGPIAAPVLATSMLVSVSAEARPGGGMSMGSRGSRTYMAPPSTATNPGGASPFSRSLTPQNGSQNGYGQNGYGQSGYGGMRSHPLGAGLMGGLIGFGLGGLLLGHGFFGGGYGGGFGGGSLLGLLIQIAIIAFIVRWLFRRFGASRMAGASGGPGYGGGIGPVGGMTGNGARPGTNLAITPTDYQQFERALLDIQQAWSMQDLRSLSRFATPEMVSYFSDQLSDLSSRNLRNVVSAVRMEQGDLSEAWSEGGREFATVAMRYSLIDVTTDLTGRVVDGSPNERQMVTELWTFARARGGSWALSAIQQGR